LLRPSANANSQTKPNNGSRRRARLTPMRLARTGAAQAAAQRAEGIATARRQSASERLAARRQRNTAIAAIRREAFNRAFADLSIRLRENRAGTTNLRAVTADDLAVDLGNDETQSGSPTASDEARSQDAGADAAIEGTRRKLPQALTWRCERMPEYSTTGLPSVSRLSVVIDSTARAVEDTLRQRPGWDELVVFFVNYFRHG
jgi:hypothetical protein